MSLFRIGRFKLHFCKNLVLESIKFITDKNFLGFSWCTIDAVLRSEFVGVIAQNNFVSINKHNFSLIFVYFT